MSLGFFETEQIIDSSKCQKQKLPVYNAINCIDNLLKEIVKANHKFYKSSQDFYSMSFKKKNNKRYIVIEVGQYKSSNALDYIGAIKINNAIFLCRGDITLDTIFRRIDHSFINVCLKKSSNPASFDFGTEPSLRGQYQECLGIDISLEVYTKAALPGYKMEERNQYKEMEK
ncbi:hypothetical protein [Niabella beijingensis]|uniref:hypothetical protein n=1 Tax=Niabella beijingensis TaxID=2872700 RepID=UPI001CBBD897|nr:hypothetical protein [Niabella beijingensis]MBZ4192071.1 hypothetical protein [Niabella beijingensis]